MSLDQQTLDGWVQAYPGLQDLYPATGMQLGLVFHSLLDEHEEGAYAIQLQMDFEAGFDDDAFKRAWDELLRRHAIFRTAFVGLDQDQPMQVVVKDARLEWREEDWRALGCEPQEEDFARYRTRDKSERFDFGRAPLMRMSLIRLSECKYRWLWTHHHSLLDGWSLAVVMKELFGIYAQLRERREVTLPRPPVYRDYIAWLCSLDPNEAETYWRDALSGVAPMRLDLPVRSGAGEVAGQEEQQLVISAQRTSALQKLAQRHRVTLNSVIQGAWAYLLHRYSGAREVVFGQTVSGRSADVARIEEMVGLFINTLPVRVEIRRGEAIGEWLHRLHAEQGKREGHGSLPLVDIQRLTGLQAGETLFDTLLVFENYPLGSQAEDAGNGASSPGLQVSGQAAHDGATGYGLTLIVVPRQALTLRLLYQRTRFARETMAAMLEHLDVILDGLVSSSTKRVRDVPYLRKADYDELAKRRNAAARTYSRSKRVHELFEEQVDRSPEAMAVVADDVRLTYREVNERANGVAQVLIEQGVGPGCVVGLCVQGAVQRTIGELGILKAGAAYAQIDPDAPVERLSYLLEDSGAELIVTQSSVRVQVQLAGAAVGSVVRGYVELERVWEAGLRTRPSVSGSAEDLACVRYESDQGGEPSGVMCSHASVCAEQARSGVHYVLDREGELLPTGAAGDLYIGGEGIGWGYRHRSALTAERFVPNAFGAKPGERLYRTGRRARWRTDGTLEHLGLGDLTRGEGPDVEPVEIERALLNHKSVAEAVVLTLEADDAQVRRIAYVVARGPGSVPAEQFIAQLKAHLRAQPRFCALPQEWLVLESLARTAAGAVDRSALPRPQGAQLKYVAPRTHLERTLVEVWQEQLGIERVGVEDNYFALGGDSIRSIALVAQARKRGLDFSVKDLFAHPTVSGLALALQRGDVRCELIAEQEIEPFALLTDQERERLSGRHDAQALEDAYPLSMMQQGMVLESLRHAHLGIYLNIHIYEFNDRWDRPMFERALSHLMARHPILRTLHDFSGERPLQLVLKDSAPQLNVVEVRDPDETALSTTLRHWMQNESAEPLDTSSSPWRLSVHVVSEQRFTFGMVVHHAQWDGWSLENFAKELYATYGLLKREGRVPEYSPLPSYEQFIALEQAALSSQAHRSYWTQKLEGATVPWWTGREKSGGTLIPCEISEATGHALAELARSLGVQEKSVWCSVYLALLSLLSGTEEVVGTVMTQGRPEVPGGEQIIGVFLNGLPIRVAMSGRRWVDLIAQTDLELREQHAFRHYPLAEIQRLTELDHSASMFNYTSWHANHEGADDERAPGKSLPRRVGGWHETNYLLNFFVHKDDKAQRCYLGVRADAQVFDAAFRERIRGYVVNIVRAIASDATAVIEKAALLGHAERHQQLIEWNATSRSYPQEQCIHELFEEQVTQAPDRIALVHEGGELTYGELNRCASGLAYELIERGVGPEVRVAVCMERSAEMVIGLLGILKAGGCYVPLDPGYPHERLELMLGDAGASLLLIQRSVRERIPAGYKGELMEVGRKLEAVKKQPIERLGRGAAPGNLAYVIYTSGSTGRPKGVGVSHAGIVNRLAWMQSRYEVGSSDRILQKTPTTFDVSVWELFLPLLSGSALVIARPEGHRDPSYLMDVINHSAITMLHFVPSMLHAFLTSESQRLGASCRALKHVICSGEALSGQLCDELFRAGYAGRLHNLYGPTEASVDVSSCECEPGIGEGVPIGLPIWNTQLHVLDPSFEPVPIGVAGELYIGGIGLARGYLGRAGLTAERFVVNPHGKAGSRLYRTGDLVRRRSDGALEFIGRADHQVKIRGYRIELGEIEEALRREAGISEAVVVARNGKGGDRQLVAYVVRASDMESSARELRAGLAKHLPSYMVPSYIVVLEALPLTTNGKVDRKALPVPEDSTSEWPYAPPEGVTEALLAELWCVLLKRERVGRHDNFFELGGHSLLMTQLASRIRESFSTQLSVRELFEHPTLATQARAVERARGAGTLIDHPVEAVSRGEPLTLSYAQQRLWFLHQYLGPNAIYNVPLALRLHGAVNEQALVRSLEELHRRHESLRTRFEVREENAVQVIDPPGPVKVEAVSAAQTLAIAHAERLYPFDLSSDRLCRIRLLRESGSESCDYVLLVTMHHSVSDGWSLGIFSRELASLYGAYANGKDSPLAPLPIQYADYAQWQRQWMRGAVLEDQVSYWREQLKGLPPLLTLPTDRPRPAAQTYRGSLERFALPASLSAQLQALSRNQGVTLFMTLLSGFAMLLGRYAGQQDVAVGTPIANRTRRETEGLIGFFANTLVMRYDLSGDPRFIDLLKCTRETALQAYAHQDVPFEQLVEEMNPQRSVSHAPLFQVMFALQNAPFEALELPDLAMRPLQAEAAAEDVEGTPEGTARFDLALSVQESPAGLVGVLEYNTDLFDRSTMRRMLAHYARLLEAIAASPQSRLSRLQMLGEEERQQLVEWNATAREYPQENCIHELFEQQVARAPDRIALVHERGALTYGELNRRANQVARYLREQGVRPEVRVGICMTRSPELAVGLLGILKAGGAYVPLDPEYPEARLEYMLTQSGCCVVLSEQHLMMDLSMLSTTAEVLPLDADLHDRLFGAYSDANVEVADSGVSPGNLAYVIYTSGSTGQPKGIAIVHRNISRLIYNDFIDYAGARKILCAASPSFDALTFELWGALLHGGCSVMAGAMRGSFGELGKLVERQAVDCAFMTTALFNQLIVDTGDSLRKLKCLLVGGEAASIGHFREGLRRLPQTQLSNIYGPTENTTFSSLHTLVEETLASRSTVPIGRPIGNTQAYVLGAEGELLPVGVMGELYLGGAGLARGYLGQAGLTAEKFVPNAFALTPGEQLYRTGDLVRHLPNGDLDFLGRVDHQVKVRGFRIELGEIESELRRHEAVRDAVVIAYQEESGSKRLVGYVVAEAGARGDDVALVNALRGQLLEHLPGYMVPSALIVLESLPLTANGKVDQQALPVPEGQGTDAEFVPPEGPTEELLAQHWCQLLKQERVGRHDSFFALGGHSLLALRVSNFVRQEFAVELELPTIFANPSIAQLREHISLALNARNLGESKRLMSAVTEDVEQGSF